MIVFACPSCQSSLQATDEHVGKTIVCPKCQQRATIPAQSAAAATAITANPAPAPTAVTTPDNVSNTRPVKRNDERDRDEPRRRDTGSGGKSAGASIALILLLVFGVGGCVVLVVGGIAVALIVPATQKVQEAKMRAETMDNLRMIGLACHAHHDAMKILPTPRVPPQPPMMISPDLSWRVSILPYIEQANVAQMVNMNADWNKAPNDVLLQQMPAVFVHKPRQDPGKMHQDTHYQYVTGPNTIFLTQAMKVRFTNISDGPSNTILVAEAQTPVPWSKAADIALAPGGPLPLPPDRFLALMADGSVRQIDRRRTSDATLRLLIDPRDGQALPPDAFD